MARSVAQPVRSIIAPSKLTQIGSWTELCVSQTSDVPSVESPFYRFKREFPIPKLVTGLAWRHY
ncbi:MAG TPA: hypothetical protein VF207_01110, partial [Chthoniobacterales bacterium]